MPIDPNSKFKALNSNYGFTLIEIIVSMSILAIIATISIPALKTFSERQLLVAETNKLASTIRQAQAYAQANLQPTTSCATDQTLNWQVLVINLTTYALKSVCNDATGAPQSSVEVQRNTLPSAIALQLTQSDGTACGTSSYINFSRNSVFFSCLNSNTFTIKLNDSLLSGTNATQTISVDKGGSVNAH